MQIRLATAEETIALGRRLGLALHNTWKRREPLRAILLYGDLGSGKTTLARGLVEALPGGDHAEVASPSFTVCNAYPTEPAVIHCDLYRNEGSNGLADGLPEEAEEALDDIAGTTPCILVEWAQRLSPRHLPPERLDIILKSCHESRSATFSAHGRVAERLLLELAR